MRIHAFLYRFLLVLLLMAGLMQAMPAEARRNKMPAATLAPRLQAYYDKLDACRPSKALRHAPLIGISTASRSGSLTTPGYCGISIIKAGGIPVPLAATDDPALIEAVVSRLDGLLMTGGEDVAPSYYGHEPHPQLGDVDDRRDDFELALFHKALERGIPIFGVCRGMQLINVAMGGTLVQDIPSEKPSDIRHRPGNLSVCAHDIDLEPDSRSARVLGVKHAEVNSSHHQCVLDVAPGLKVTAWSPDGIPEMLEGYPDLRIMATQYHPEVMVAEKDDPTMLRYFKFFVEECRK